MPGRREENAGKRMLKHLSAILEKSGVIIFEYHIKTDTLIRYNKELEVEVTVDENHINSIRSIVIISGIRPGSTRMTAGKPLNFTVGVLRGPLISVK